MYTEEGEIIGFMGVLHQPHGVNKKIKRVSRLVILPDYQGIGLGYRFLKSVAMYYTAQGFDFAIVTSAKNLIMKLARSDEWRLINLGVHKCLTKRSAIDFNRESLRKVKTASFFYRTR